MFAHAYVDESYDLTIGVYILTASIVDLTYAEEIRCTLRELHVGDGKLHWYRSDPEHRLKYSKLLGTLPATHLVVVGRAEAMRPERARRKCFECLLPWLESTGTEIAIVEARQEVGNKHDLAIANACRRKKLITDRLQMTFARGDQELLLWLADIACGAALQVQRGDFEYLEQLGDIADLLAIDAN